ncbi:MAG: putative K(+)-stimulated pyrophosphate-energized sodium pump [Spirochaetes bacterium ADurb.BinA120]|jgi:K(+)-stimulated pyrophosphate-energized sodium pump|nr:MAG: putative K(+)-stimulated pyrophosphate-energized sodium pump [Spirochaetes bacterium ADurb.BinA120]
MVNPLFYIAPVASLIALFFAWVLYRLMMGAEKGNETMEEIAGYVREGAYAYLKRQYTVVTFVFMALVILFAVLAYFGIQNPFVPVAFLTGGFFSGLCGFLGMKTATNASSRTAQGASKSLNRGLQVAFRSGAVMGLIVVGFGLLDISLWYMVLNYIYDNNIWNLSETLVQKVGIAGGLFDMHIVNSAEFKHAKLVEITTTMITFGMGASTQALFARVGGGIYTKAADVGADLVGKVEAGIPEDDPRNPATIADNVGDNVGDVAGMGADLYESYCGSILATAALGAALPLVATEATEVVKPIIAPMIVAGLGILFSIIGIFMVRTKEEATMKNLLVSLNIGVWASSLLIIAGLAVMAHVNLITWGVFGAIIAGLIAGLIIGQSTEYYTADEYAPTQGIAKQHTMGPATGILDGMSTGMLSAGIPVVTIVLGIIIAYASAGGFSQGPSFGLYGIGFAAVGMLATLGITLATDAYGPIADNAGGNAEMSHLPPEVRKRTDALDMLGNTTAATGKGFAIGSAALTAMALLAAYIEEVKIWIGKYAATSAEGFFQVGAVKFYAQKLPEGVIASDFDVIAHTAQIKHFAAAYDMSLMNPLVLCGLFLGAMVAFVFCAMTIKAVGRAAGSMVEEVRRQFKEFPGIMQGTQKPDYARCVEISTKGAQSKMIVPSFLALLIPVVTGLILGVAGVMGLLAGSLATGFSVACMLNNAGGAWDNAKKFIEKGNYGGKGSEAHKAGVIGDTVGDPFKDTAGPSLNILLKLMSMVSVVFAGVIVKLSPVIGKALGFVK